MIAAKDLIVGSVVRLISGSPKMTVEGVSPVVTIGGGATDRAICSLVWFSGRGELQEADLSNVLLVWPRAQHSAEDAPSAEEAE